LGGFWTLRKLRCSSCYVKTCVAVMLFVVFFFFFFLSLPFLSFSSHPLLFLSSFHLPCAVEPILRLFLYFLSVPDGSGPRRDGRFCRRFFSVIFYFPIVSARVARSSPDGAGVDYFWLFLGFFFFSCRVLYRFFVQVIFSFSFFLFFPSLFFYTL